MTRYFIFEDDHEVRLMPATNPFIVDVPDDFYGDIYAIADEAGSIDEFRELLAEAIEDISGHEYIAPPQ